MTTFVPSSSPPPKKILNDPADAVAEFMQGLLLQYPSHLHKLANHPVLLSASALSSSQPPPPPPPQNQQSPPQIVHLISGGGSGHEPSHAGWLGQGMLSAAVCGGIFASPSVHSILAAIRIVRQQASNMVTTINSNNHNNGAGILLIIKNYTGDRLNFGMAAERANQDTLLTNSVVPIPVEMVVVADDCALSRTKGITGARGVAGTVLVHKIAGAAARAGQSLAHVAAMARLVTARLGTLGLALDSVTVPGADRINDRLKDAETMEIGLGIHGEAGRKQIKIVTAQAMAEELIATIQDYGRVVVDNEVETNSSSPSSQIVPLFAPGDDVCILVNNLGGTSNFEMSILTRSIVQTLESEVYGVKVTRVLVGSYMTSFNMHGASLTILNTTNQPQLLEYLDAPTDAPAWSTVHIWNRQAHPTARPSSIDVPEVVVDETTAAAADVRLLPPLADDALGQVFVKDQGTVLATMLRQTVQALADAEPLLTQYDTIVGDGDCGFTMKRGAVELLDRLQQGTLSLTHPVTLFSAVAEAISASMGGTSGILLELLFRKMSSTLSRSTSGNIGVTELCRSFQAGVDAVSLYGGAQVGSRTMLDALVPAAQTLLATQSLSQAAAAARIGANGTATMTSASAGRSNYLSEDTLQGTPDPGAMAVAIVLEALAAAS